MDEYTVKNGTKNTIFWRDGLWYSPPVDKGGEHTVTSDHNATVTLFEKVDGRDQELGDAIIPKYDGLCEVRGRWDWSISERENK